MVVTDEGKNLRTHRRSIFVTTEMRAKINLIAARHGEKPADFMRLSVVSAVMRAEREMEQNQPEDYQQYRDDVRRMTRELDEAASRKQAVRG